MHLDIYASLKNSASIDQATNLPLVKATSYRQPIPYRKYIMEFNWTKILSVGNIILDADHKYLISIVNNATGAIRENNRLRVMEELERLDNWQRIHFANEKTILQQINFDYAKHLTEQENVWRELTRLTDLFKTSSVTWSARDQDHYADLLHDWMIGSHITKLDMKLKAALETYDYSFWPDWNGSTNNAAINIADQYLQS